MHCAGLALVILLAACGGRSSTGPAWPKSAGTEIDPDDEDEDHRGESLDPRTSEAVASVEASTEPEPAKSETPLDPAAKPADAKPADAKPTDPAAKPAEDPPTVEEIIIEVNPN